MGSINGKRLTSFPRDGLVEVDSNAVERFMRPICDGEAELATQTGEGGAKIW